MTEHKWVRIGYAKCFSTECHYCGAPFLVERQHEPCQKANDRNSTGQDR